MSCLALPPTRSPALAPSVAPRPFDDDAVLVAAMIGDSPAAWRAFHVRFGALVAHSIYRITRRFWRVATTEDAQDIAGAFYLSLVARDKRKLRSFDPSRGYRLASWIRVLAMNASYDHLRKIGREPMKEELAAAEDVPCDALDAPGQIQRIETLAAVTRELTGFTARDREFAKLHLVEGLDAPSVAAQMSVSVKTIYSKKNKIIMRLAAALDRSVR